MRICVLSGNPKKNGLCHEIIEAVKLGIREGGADAEDIRLCDFKLDSCLVCGDGWGPCRDEHYCINGQDGFDEIKERIRTSDAIVIVSPVYWGETVETMKSFLDRLRRCEFNGTETLRNKQVVLIASAGGSGNGLLTCLEQLERFCRHIGANVVDYIGVNRWNAEAKKLAAKTSAFVLAVDGKDVPLRR